jgi:cytochrome P450
MNIVGIRRKAVLPYDFADGTIKVPQGATVCVPAYDMLHDPSRYPHPEEFNGARFLPKDGSKQEAKFTQVSHDFPMWGYGSLACPGRFHASLVIKTVISQLLLRYDLGLENEGARRKWTWETFAMPYESTRIVLKERTV